jgi:DNA polymerase-1
LNGGLEVYNEAKKAEKDDNHKDHLFWVKQKKRAKMINFGILYGQGPKKLATEMDCTEEEASQFIEDWLNAYPRVRKWIENQHKMANKYGYVYNIFGRKRRLLDATLTKWEAKELDMGGKRAEAFRQSVNAPIQGGSSDLCQLSAIEIWEQRIKGLLPFDLYQLYTVHDSLGYAIKEEYLEEVVPKIIKICDNPNTEKWFGFKMKHVNMKVSPEYGINWGSLNEYTKHK